MRKGDIRRGEWYWVWDNYRLRRMRCVRMDRGGIILDEPVEVRRYLDNGEVDVSIERREINVHGRDVQEPVEIEDDP